MAVFSSGYRGYFLSGWQGEAKFILGGMVIVVKKQDRDCIVEAK